MTLEKEEAKLLREWYKEEGTSSSS